MYCIIFMSQYSWKTAKIGVKPKSIIICILFVNWYSCVWQQQDYTPFRNNCGRPCICGVGLYFSVYCFVGYCLSSWTLFAHYIICPSIDVLSLPIWYLQTFLVASAKKPFVFILSYGPLCIACNSPWSTW
jgi:hypothetical protein